MPGMIQSRFSCENDCCTLNWTTTLAVSEFIVDKIPSQGEHSAWNCLVESNLSFLIYIKNGKIIKIWNVEWQTVLKKFQHFSDCFPLRSKFPPIALNVVHLFSFVNGHQTVSLRCGKYQRFKARFSHVTQIATLISQQPSTLIFEQSIERWLGRYVMWELIYIG